MKEQRKNERHRVRFHLVYDDGSSFNAGVVHDVSEGGLFLETALPLAVGTEVILKPLEESQDFLFEAHAKVMRSVPYDDPNRMADQPAGMGLLFLGLNDEEKKRVVDLIRKLEAKAAARTGGEKDLFLGVVVHSEGNEPSSQG